MTQLQKGRYRARFAEGEADLSAAQNLRSRVFRGAAADAAFDRDDYDKGSAHVLIEEVQSNRLACCFRLLPLADGQQISRSYSAQFYDLSGLETYGEPMAEMGRFCIEPAFQDPDILRLAWGFLTRYVDENRIGMLFGCSSFQGVDGEKFADSFALLRRRHLAPMDWRPKVKAPEIFRFDEKQNLPQPDFRNAMKHMPPLLRTYLAMGGLVSDHAVIDRELQTLHVFTGLEVNSIPPARARLLRAITE
ncbi:MAG: GNAT family N-acetyltransferase [Alphaproteobacteria bacterium]|nr:GNAT family N-acetyltransferase [Alphaproteobacteria bacterium]